VASSNEIQVRTVSLLRAPEDLIHSAATPWSSNWLVGHIYRRSSGQSPSVMEWVLQGIPRAPPFSRNHAPQTTWIPASTARDRKCEWVHQKVQLSATIWWSSYWHWREEGRAVQKWTKPPAVGSLSSAPWPIIRCSCECRDWTRGSLPSRIGGRREDERKSLVRTFGGLYWGCYTEVSSSVNSISWQVMSCTSTTTVESSPTSAAAATGVTPDTYPVTSACITLCTSAEGRNSQSPVLQLQVC
jgi:hypothetical protein